MDRVFRDINFALHQHWSIISEAYFGGLPSVVGFKSGDMRGPYERDRAVTTLRDIDVLSDLKLRDDFRVTLDDVAKGRPIHVLSSPDIIEIGLRYSDWH